MPRHIAKKVQLKQLGKLKKCPGKHSMFGIEQFNQKCQVSDRYHMPCVSKLPDFSLYSALLSPLFCLQDKDVDALFNVMSQALPSLEIYPLLQGMFIENLGHSRITPVSLLTPPPAMVIFSVCSKFYCGLLHGKSAGWPACFDAFLHVPWRNLFLTVSFYIFFVSKEFSIFLRAEHVEKYKRLCHRHHEDLQPEGRHELMPIRKGASSVRTWVNCLVFGEMKHIPSLPFIFLLNIGAQLRASCEDGWSFESWLMLGTSNK